MSERLFKRDKARTHKGGFTVSMVGATDLVKRLQKIEDGGEIAIVRAISDFNKQAPQLVSEGILEHYGVDAAAIKKAQKKPRRGKTSIRVAGVTVDGVTLVYKGRTLTPVHFDMSPTERPKDKQKERIKIPGQAIADGSPVAMVAQPKRYRVKATIIKGKRASLPPGTFIAPGNGGVSLPFQRVGEARKPIEAIRTLSVPQMIDGRAQETIEKKIRENLGECFEHHIKQVMK